MPLLLMTAFSRIMRLRDLLGGTNRLLDGNSFVELSKFGWFLIRFNPNSKAVLRGFFYGLLVVIWVGDHTEVYQFFEDMLKNFDRDDLVKLWDLVRERFSSTEPTDDKERALWVELKRLFEPDTDDLLELQRYMHDPLTWRLYDTCGVHHVSTETGLDIFMLVEKDYPMTRGLPMLMLVNKLQVDQHSEMADELLRKIFILANRPRH
ncbi:hypothetical protein Tco_0878911 [Tanacetum coccineum]|uniref:Uncharacterized protein n=1 Tax=Tanacetum coccineum TaxID=301880 RepID=A0ABQ5BZ80_9ASTR